MNGNRCRRWWTDDEIEFLEKYTGARDYNWIADKLDRSFSSVAHKIQRLGLTGERRKSEGKGITKWTSELVNRLKELYPSEKNKAIAEELDVSAGSIRQKAYALGLKKSSDFRKKISSEAGRSCGIWSRKKDQELKELYPTEDTKKLAGKFHTTPSTVRRRAWELGVKKKRKRKVPEPQTGDYLKRKGEKGERMVEKSLEKKGWKIIRKGNTRTPYDFVVKKGNEKRAIQVKYGHKMMLKEDTSNKLKKMNLPVYLIFIGEESGNTFHFRLEDSFEKGE